MEYKATDDLTLTFKLLGSDYRGEGLSSMLEAMSCPAGAISPTSFGLVDPYGDCRLNRRNAIGWLPQEVAPPWSSWREERWPV